METFDATAWRADWLLAWLASVGVTYRDRSIRLSWSAEAVPHAIFHMHNPDRLDAVLPSIGELKSLAIARETGGLLDFKRNPSREAFAERAALARQTGDLSVGATLSDIGIEDKDDLPHSPFDAPAPQGITLAQRVVASRAACAEGETLRDSMRGKATLAEINGLGFDLRRLAASAVPGRLAIEPFVETMAFSGMMLFTQVGEYTRGWASGSSRRTGAFTWPTWRTPLDWSALDSALDLYHSPKASGSFPSAEFDSIAYRPTSSSETNRGFDGVLRKS